MRARLGRRLIAPPLALFFAAFLFYPLWHVLAGALVVDGGPSLAAFRLLLGNDVALAAIGRSLLLAAVVTTASFAIAAPLALLFVNYRFAGKGLLQGALLLALVLPPFVGALGLRQLLARFGTVNLLLLESGLRERPVDFLHGFPLLMVALVQTLHLFPILFLNVAASLAAVDPSLEEAAAAAGAGRWRRLGRVTLPLALPGAFSGAAIVFIFAFTDLGTPLVFDLRGVAPLRIFEMALAGGREPAGYALVVVVLGLSLAFYLAGRRLLARAKEFTASRSGGARALRAVPAPWRPLLYLGLALVALLAVLPHLAILLLALAERWFFTALPESLTLGHFAAVLDNEIAYLGIRNSLLYAGCSTALDLALGLAVAWLAVRGGGRLGAAFDACAMLPLAVPGIVLAFGCAAAFQDTPLDPLRDPFLLLVFAYALRRLPFVARAADSGLRQVPPELEEAARGLGAGPARVLRRITGPLLASSLLAGALVAFAFAMLEVSESLILAPAKQDFPIAKAIYTLMGDLADGPHVASALGALGVLLVFYCLCAAARLLARGLADLFRQ